MEESTARMNTMANVDLPAPSITEADTVEGVCAQKPSASVLPNSSPHGDSDRYPTPTDKERCMLRKVPDSISPTAYLLCLVELAERASYYGVQTVFNNFMQFPLPDGGDGSGAIGPDNANDSAGALNLGLRTASALGTLFTFMAYVVPFAGAWMADCKLGRYKTIALGVAIGGVAHVIMIAGAAPSLLRAGKGLVPFAISFFLLAFGAGIFKPNVAPMVIDQYQHQREYTRTLKMGEKVLVDPETTVQRIMLVFYTCINIGSFFSIATTYAEKYVGFWCAFLLPGIIYFVLPVLLVLMYKRTVKKAPQGSELTNFLTMTWMAVRTSRANIFAESFWANVRPAALAGRGIAVKWTDEDVSDAQRTCQACQIFLYFPIYNLCRSGVGAISSNQGASMTSNGAPNDLLGNFNPLVIVLFSPLMAHIVYPWLARMKVQVGRISRITIGFVLAIMAGVCGALVQWRVYETSVCGYHASSCHRVSRLSIWWQLPNVFLGAMSEVFCNVTAYELAYSRAPAHMKSLVVAMFLFTTALSSALAEILIPAIEDPTLVWAWAAPAIALSVQTVVFWYRHGSANDDAFMTYHDDIDGEQPPSRSAGEKGGN